MIKTQNKNQSGILNRDRRYFLKRIKSGSQFHVATTQRRAIYSDSSALQGLFFSFWNSVIVAQDHIDFII